MAPPAQVPTLLAHPSCYNGERADHAALSKRILQRSLTAPEFEYWSRPSPGRWSNSAQDWSNSDQMWPNSGKRVLDLFWPTSAKFGRSRPESFQLWPRSGNFGRARQNMARLRFGRVWPEVAEVSPHVAGSGPNLADVGRHRPRSGRNRTNLDDSGAIRADPKLDLADPNHGKCSAASAPTS